MKQFTKSLMAAIVAIPLLFGCTKVDQPIMATGITLSETTKTLTLDPDAVTKESFVLTATVTPSNYTYGTITWSGGKVYDDEIVKLTPSADGKTCTVTANMVNTDGVNVYARISGDKKEYSAVCDVKVVKKKVHATAIEFGDTTAKTIKINESINVSYVATPVENDDLISAVCSNPSVISAVPNTTNKTIMITGKVPGTSTVTISCYDGETKKCESTTQLSVTVSEPTALNYTLGETAVNHVSGLTIDAGATNLFKITPSSNIVISKTEPMALKVTPKNQTAVDTANYDCTVGLMAKGTSNWIFVSTTGSSATYGQETEYTLESGKDYYVKVTNNRPLASNEYDIHVTMPKAK